MLIRWSTSPLLLALACCSSEPQASTVIISFPDRENLSRADVIHGALAPSTDDTRNGRFMWRPLIECGARSVMLLNGGVEPPSAQRFLVRIVGNFDVACVQARTSADFLVEPVSSKP